MRYLVILWMFLASCSSAAYKLTLDNRDYKLRPGAEIDDVRKKLIRHQYIYSKNGTTETLQYYCVHCGPQPRLITLTFHEGQLDLIENKKADSIY